MQAGISELPTDVRGCSSWAYRGLSGLAHIIEISIASGSTSALSLELFTAAKSTQLL